MRLLNSNYYLGSMEIGQTFSPPVDLMKSHEVTVKPFMVQQELRFEVVIDRKPTQFFHDGGRLVAEERIPEDLELAIGDWIEGHYE